MYVYMYVCMYICMYICIYVCMYVCVYVCIYVCIYVCMYVYLYDIYLLLCGGQRSCPKHIEFYSKNKFEKLAHLVGFIMRIRGLEL